MNIDNLKDAWANDKTEGSQLPFNQVPAGKTSSVVSKIRKNMKRELILNTIAFIILILLFIRDPKNALSIFIFSISVFLLVLQTVYYFFRFYLFYKKTGHYDLTIKKSIHKIIYELELNIEIYKTFNYCALPLVILIIFSGSTDGVVFIQQKITDGYVVKYTSLLVIFLILIFAQIIAIAFLNLHIRLRYGRYLAELKKIMEDLDEPIANEQ